MTGKLSDWIPIALSRDVPEGTTRAALVEGREIVIWRGGGAAHVWEDRCPHRGMRLSFGFVRENALNCLYHGWQYGTGAQCQRIPAHPDLNVPPTIRANAYASTETGGMIWMCFAEALEPPALPDLTPAISLAVEAEADAVLAAAGGNVAGPHLFTLSLAGETLFVGWHRVNADRTMLHAAMTGSANTAAAMQRIRALRFDTEQGVAA